jgi:hypothetical protein
MRRGTFFQSQSVFFNSSKRNIPQFATTPPGTFSSQREYFLNRGLIHFEFSQKTKFENSVRKVSQR